VAITCLKTAGHGPGSEQKLLNSGRKQVMQIKVVDCIKPVVSQPAVRNQFNLRQGVISRWKQPCFSLTKALRI
jgi:hypothetical protein